MRTWAHLKPRATSVPIDGRESDVKHCSHPITYSDGCQASYYITCSPRGANRKNGTEPGHPGIREPARRMRLQHNHAARGREIEGRQPPRGSPSPLLLPIPRAMADAEVFLRRHSGRMAAQPRGSPVGSAALPGPERSTRLPRSGRSTAFVSETNAGYSRITFSRGASRVPGSEGETASSRQAAS
jgi:hypothetical protein